ncbi:Fic family protein [bacterium]|nr:Fic family protein [bacterium]
MKYIWEKADWFDFKYDNNVLIKPLSQLRVLQGKLLGRIASLDIKLETEAQSTILVEEILRTSEIEGEKFNRDAVRSSISVRLGLPRGIGTQDKRVDGLVDILLDAVYFHDRKLTIERLNGWHASLFPTGYSGLRKIRTGEMRGLEPMQVVSGPISKEQIHFEALPEKRLAREMELFLEWWHSSLKDMDGILRAATAHLRFLTIHPYEDGNGRLARALTDMALAQDEKLKVRFYSISSEIMRRKEEYYEILESVQKCRLDTTQWYLWFIECITASIKDSQSTINNVFAKVDFWTKFSQTTLNERQKKVINRLLEAGPNNFIGGLTTRKYVAMVKVSRATAFREISDMLNNKILVKLPAKGRSTRYDLNWSEFTLTENS